jgi:hypothetical protein
MYGHFKKIPDATLAEGRSDSTADQVIVLLKKRM